MGSYRKSIRNKQEIARRSIAFDKNFVAFDTKSKRNCRTSTRNLGNQQKSIRIQQDIARQLITFDKKSLAFDAKSNGNYRKKNNKESIGNR